MEKIIYLLVVCISVFFAGCKDDDLQKQVDELEQRVITLETLCAQMNTNISSMQTIIEALKQQDYITGVNPVEENTVIIGYTITFAKNKPITIYNGENGSFLGAKKDSDGLYYWVLDGDWLFDDDGGKMQVSGVTPQLKIENGRWLVSIDTGKTWNDVGQATGESFFKEVDNSAEDFVRFVFADGSEIQVPKKTTFAISFSETLPVKITAGETVEIAYTLSQGNEKTLVKAITSNGWRATVNKKDNLSGTISITAPTPITDDEVLVFISDGKEKTVMSAISFCIVILENVQDNTVKVGGSGGDLNLEVTSNMAIRAVPKVEWIETNEQVESRALVTNNFRFTIKANEGELNRTGNIEIQDAEGKVLKTIIVIQGNALESELAKEKEILTKFYFATNGDQWENKTNWCSDKPVGEWYGIKTNHNGLVSEILFVYNDPTNLNGNNLSGYLIPELGDLSELFFLEIQFSQISGNIPEELGKLKHLYHLNLSYNQLSGEIPTSIGQMTSLGALYLHENQLSGEIPSSIWLSNLTRIELNGNQLSGELPVNINNLQGLTYLDLSNNQLVGTIPTTLCELNNLEVLYLGNNQLTGEIPEDIGNLKKLRWLKLGNNQLTGVIPESIKQCSNLNNIDLEQNQLHGDIMLDFFINQCSSIMLGHNNLTGTIPVELATWMDKNNTLDVSCNCLTGTIPWDVVSHFRWAALKPYIEPQNVGFHLDMPVIYESKDYSEDGKVVLLQKATEGNGVNIVISGDGFADVDFASGHFDDVMNKTLESLFSLEPMKSFRYLFNVYIVKAVSKHNIFFKGSDTAFGCNFGGNTFVGFNDAIIDTKYGPRVENFKRDRDVFIIIVNAYQRLGTTILGGASSSMVCGLYSKIPALNNPNGFRQILNHEFGHAFGKLADEYWYENTATPIDEVSKQYIIEQHSYGNMSNIDVTGDPTSVLWSHFITDKRYQNENIGVYEGGHLCNKGVWRATENSIMRIDTGDAVFNAPSREAIYKRIMKLAYGDSWQYDYEKFVEYDAINRSSVPKLLRRTVEIPKDFKPLPPPVIIYK